jgi:hypothetical protein
VTRSPRRPLPILIGALALALSAVAPAAADAPDWNAVAGVETVEIVTNNEDGTTKETTIWLAVVDGQGYIRTGNTRWEANIERDPNVVLRIEGNDYPLRVEFVSEPVLRGRIEETFRSKYGFSDAFIAIFRSGDPKIMRLLPR